MVFEGRGRSYSGSSMASVMLDAELQGTTQRNIQAALEDRTAELGVFLKQANTHLFAERLRNTDLGISKIFSCALSIYLHVSGGLGRSAKEVTR